ncbi:MAG: FecR domain-containing protein [Planctomycetes bacterium]|nr:FecR domain-containing protein [Planctomycetota bacterium]
MDCRQVSGRVWRRLDGEAAPAEAAEVASHLLRCPACREGHDEAAWLDAQLRSVLRAGARPLLDEGFAREVARRAIPAQAPRAGGRRWLAAAAAVLLAVGFYFLLGGPSAAPPGFPPGPDSPGHAMVCRAVGVDLVVGTEAEGWRRVIGEVALGAGDGLRNGVAGLAELHYPDGSRVTLDAGSQLVVMPLGEDQVVRLEAGRLYARVAPRVRGAFLVETPHALVRVVGTRFEVAVDGTRTTATVVEGRVRVVPRGPDGLRSGAVLLEPSQAGTALAEGPVRVAAVQPRDTIRWLDLPEVEPRPSDPPPMAMPEPAPATGTDEPARGVPDSGADQPPGVPDPYGERRDLPRGPEEVGPRERR